MAYGGHGNAMKLSTHTSSTQLTNTPEIDNEFLYTVSADIPWMKKLLTLDDKLKIHQADLIDAEGHPVKLDVLDTSEMDELALEMSTVIKLYESRGVSLPETRYFDPYPLGYEIQDVFDTNLVTCISHDGEWYAYPAYAVKLQYDPDDMFDKFVHRVFLPVVAMGGICMLLMFGTHILDIVLSWIFNLQHTAQWVDMAMRWIGRPGISKSIFTIVIIGLIASYNKIFLFQNLPCYINRFLINRRWGHAAINPNSNSLAAIITVTKRKLQDLYNT